MTRHSVLIISTVTWCLWWHERGFSPFYFRPCRRISLCFFLLFSCQWFVLGVALLLRQTQCDSRSFVFFISRGSLLCTNQRYTDRQKEKKRGVLFFDDLLSLSRERIKYWLFDASHNGIYDLHVISSFSLLEAYRTATNLFEKISHPVPKLEISSYNGRKASIEMNSNVFVFVV